MNCGLRTEEGMAAGPPRLRTAASGPRRPECAKQTQLPEAGHRGGVRRPRYPSVPLFYYSTIPVLPGPPESENVRNKPNSPAGPGGPGDKGHGRVQTKPICPGQAGGDLLRANKPNLPARSIVQNKANFASRPTGIWERIVPNKLNSRESPPGRGGPITQNEPNSRVRQELGACAAKQSQFLDCGFRIADCKWRCGGTCHAKQSQFPAAGISHHSTIPSFQYSTPTPGVQTKPILLSWAGQTTPVMGSTKYRHRRQP